MNIHPGCLVTPRCGQALIFGKVVSKKRKLKDERTWSYGPALVVATTYIGEKMLLYVIAPEGMGYVWEANWNLDGAIPMA